MLLKAREIQEKYKIAHNSLIEWENKKVLTSHRTVGGHRRWLEDDIQKLLTIHEAKEEKRSQKKPEEKLKSENKSADNSTILGCSPVVHLALVIENADGIRTTYTLEEIVELIHGGNKKPRKVDRRRTGTVKEARQRDVGD